MIRRWLDHTDIETVYLNNVRVHSNVISGLLWDSQCVVPGCEHGVKKDKMHKKFVLIRHSYGTAKADLANVLNNIVFTELL